MACDGNPLREAPAVAGPLPGVLVGLDVDEAFARRHGLHRAIAAGPVKRNPVSEVRSPYCRRMAVRAAATCSSGTMSKVTSSTQTRPRPIAVTPKSRNWASGSTSATISQDVHPAGRDRPVVHVVQEAGLAVGTKHMQPQLPAIFGRRRLDLQPRAEPHRLAAIGRGREALHQVAHHAGHGRRRHDHGASALAAASLVAQFGQAAGGFLQRGNEPARGHLARLAFLEAEVARTGQGVGPAGEADARLGGDLTLGGEIAQQLRIGGVRLAALAELLLTLPQLQQGARHHCARGGGIAGDALVRGDRPRQVAAHYLAMNRGLQPEGRIVLRHGGPQRKAQDDRDADAGAYGSEPTRIMQAGGPRYRAG